jgi:hypothetical protein
VADGLHGEAAALPAWRVGEMDETVLLACLVLGRRRGRRQLAAAIRGWVKDLAKDDMQT